MYVFFFENTPLWRKHDLQIMCKELLIMCSPVRHLTRMETNNTVVSRQ